jgi:hypothetical protein
MIEGPVTGGQHGWAFARPLIDLADKGYVEAEFFLSGEAATYAMAPGAQMHRDGKWAVQPRGKVPFKTRLLVYRPADPATFNGTAVVCWNNVTAGYELFFGESPEVLEGGYAYICASVQKVGVHGFEDAPQGLVAWDAARYGALSIPTDDASYDIFTQVARAVGPSRDTAGGAVDPMGGLAVKQVIGLGASQSAGRLATYVNAVHPLLSAEGRRAFDGFILQIYFGSGATVEASDRPVAGDRNARPLPRGQSLIRDDLDVPAMIVNTELEAIACHPVRQPDTPRFRTWEAAALTHVSHQAQVMRNAKYRRDFGAEPPPASEAVNRIYIQPYYDAALHHMIRWSAGGAPPPSQPGIDFTETGEVIRDAHGIACGGVRLPQAAAPVAANSSIPVTDDFAGRLRGTNKPFGAAKLAGLYGDEAGYLAAFRRAAEAAVEADVMLKRDVEPAVAEAASEYRRASGTETAK